MQKSNEQGFTLVEVLMGMFIFTIGALASAVMIVSGIQTAAENKHRSAVAALAAERMEELRNRPWQSVSGEPSLAAGGTILSDAQLNTAYAPYPEYGFYEEVDPSMTDDYVDTYNSATYYLIMWEINDLTEAGVEYKRITVKGVAMDRPGQNHNWIPRASFDHVTMVFREEQEHANEYQQR